MKDKVTAKILKKVVKRLLRKSKAEKPYYVEVENSKIRTDFLRVIGKRELINTKLIIDNEGNTKQIRVKKTLLIW